MKLPAAAVKGRDRPAAGLLASWLSVARRPSHVARST